RCRDRAVATTGFVRRVGSNASIGPEPRVVAAAAAGRAVRAAARVSDRAVTGGSVGADRAVTGGSVGADRAVTGGSVGADRADAGGWLVADRAGAGRRAEHVVGTDLEWCARWSAGRAADAS